MFCPRLVAKYHHNSIAAKSGRLGDFNAPELKQKGGRAAKAALRRLTFGKNVECIAGDRSYDRTVAVCTLNGRRLGDLLRLEGVPEGGN